jgi:hypothetical protein
LALVSEKSSKDRTQNADKILKNLIYRLLTSPHFKFSGVFLMFGVLPSGGKTSAKFRLKAGLRTLENLKIGVLYQTENGCEKIAEARTK